MKTLSPSTEDRKYIADYMKIVHENWHSGAGEIVDMNKFNSEVEAFLIEVIEEVRSEEDKKDTFYKFISSRFTHDNNIWSYIKELYGEYCSKRRQRNKSH